MPEKNLAGISILRLAASALLLVAASCSDTTGSSALGAHGKLSVPGQTVFLGFPGEQLQSLPAVKVYDDRNGNPLANVSVRFTSSGGPPLDYTATTGADGIAQLNSLKLSATPLSIP